MSINGKRSSDERTLIKTVVAEDQEITIGGVLETSGGAVVVVPFGDALGAENRAFR
jgi:hypothetical protein